MPKFTFVCMMHDEDLVKEIEASSRPEGNVICPDPECKGIMQRSIQSANVVVKGASEANDYYVSPTNAEIGLGSALDLEQEAIKSPEDYLEQEDKDIKKDYDRSKKAEKAELDKRIGQISQKYPDYMNKFTKSLKAKIEAKKQMKGIK